MNSFFRTFFASLLALLIFSVVAFFCFLGFISGLASHEKVKTGAKAVLVVDLAEKYPEISVENPLAAISDNDKYSVPSLYDVVRMIHVAKTDSAVKGIYIKCGSNGNGLASSEEIRNAVLDFKTSGKFVYAYGEAITQGAYFVANAADKVYCSPKGGVDWRGFAMQLAFLKGTLEKLEIEPQIFYAGKFKSATEPFREKQMTEANKLQSSVILNDLYGHYLEDAAQVRKIDTATLHGYANNSRIQFAADALHYGLVDGLKYDDEIKDEIKQRLQVDKYEKINFISVGRYAKAVDVKKKANDQIAIIYAQGDVIDGKGNQEVIASDDYRELIRRARLDKDVKAIVLRVNSGGGSSMASETIWREVSLAKKEKPVVVSFGDVAASGAYYLSCNADSIFAQPNTITGSIGVFSLLPNLQKFFNDKLGITFDGLKTAPDADMLTIAKPLTDAQKRYLQNGVDSVYKDFKTRVAEGRKKDIAYIDSIGQGRIWSGTRALQLGLVDRIGGIDDAIACAARMAKLSEYGLKEYPEPKNFFDLIFDNYRQDAKTKAIKEELGEEGMKTYSTIKRVKKMMGVTQARMPFDLDIE